MKQNLIRRTGSGLLVSEHPRRIAENHIGAASLSHVQHQLSQKLVRLRISLLKTALIPNRLGGRFSVFIEKRLTLGHRAVTRRVAEGVNIVNLIRIFLKVAIDL